MEELALSLLENSLAGYEPTISRYGSQSREHLKRLMSDLILLKAQTKETQQIVERFEGSDLHN